MEPLGNKFYSDAALVGQVLGGDYLIEERAGQGGMAWVYRATHRRLGGAVAVKILFSHFLDDAGLRTRFLREARSQYTLNHPHIVRVLDFIEESGLVGFVSEWCDAGELLRWWRPREGRLSLGRLQSLVFPVLDAMGYAHTEGVIHRDLKPHNILVQRRGDTLVPKVTDFGIAKFASQQSLTRPGMMVGTLQYMAPEQVEGRQDTDHRSDIYSLGVMLYQMLSGHLPFEGESMSLVMKVLEHAPPALPPIHIPAPLADVVMRCLAKDPAERYDTCGDVRAALAAAIAQCGDSISLTETWRQRVDDMHSLDPDGEVSLIRDQVVSADASVPAGSSPDSLGHPQGPAPQAAELPPVAQVLADGLQATLAAEQAPPISGAHKGRLTQTLTPRPSPVPATASFQEAKAPVPRQASVLRPIPVGLDSVLLEPPKQSGGWLQRLLLGILLLVCGIGAGGFLVFKQQSWLGRWSQAGDAGAMAGRTGLRDAGQRRVLPLPDDTSGRHVRVVDASTAVPEQTELATGPDGPGQKPERLGADRAISPTSPKGLRLACKRGRADACVSFSVTLLKQATPGSSQVPDLAKEARQWLAKACDDEHPRGCFLLGQLYHTGRGGVRDDVKARMFFRRSCQQSWLRACLLLGRLNQGGFGGPYDASEAITNYAKACAGKIALACHLAGVVWMTRPSPMRNCVKARSFLQRACQMGLQKACELRCEDGGR